MSAPTLKAVILQAFTEGYVNGVNHTRGRSVVLESMRIGEAFWSRVRDEAEREFPAASSSSTPLSETPSSTHRVHVPGTGFYELEDGHIVITFDSDGDRIVQKSPQWEHADAWVQSAKQYRAMAAHDSAVVALFGHCSRCLEPIKDFSPPDGGMTAGYYVAEAWAKYANPGEVYICDACMWSDPRYVADYGLAPLSETPSDIAPTFSGRGFARWPMVTDNRGVTVEVAESSAASGPHIWVFTQGGEESYKKPMDGSAHLTLEQATALRDTLTSAIRFMSTRFAPASLAPLSEPTGEGTNG